MYPRERAEVEPHHRLLPPVRPHKLERITISDMARLRATVNCDMGEVRRKHARRTFATPMEP